MTKRADAQDITIGRRICAARMEKNRSQGDLARVVGVTFQQVQKYEKGTNRVAASRLGQIASYLGKPVSWFYGGDYTVPQDNEPGLLERMLGDHYGLRLAQSYLMIEDPNLRRSIADLAETLARVPTHKSETPS